MRPPFYLASLLAACLALLPAVIRLYESLANEPATGWLYVGWLAAWILTAATLLWSTSSLLILPPVRIALGLCGGGMLFALVMLVAAGEQPRPTIGLLAALGNIAVLAGAAIAARRAPWRSWNQASWILAALGALVLAIASLFLSRPTSAIVQAGLPGGSFLLGAGLSLALGAVERSPPGAPPARASASQEP